MEDFYSCDRCGNRVEAFRVEPSVFRVGTALPVRLVYSIDVTCPCEGGPWIMRRVLAEEQDVSASAATDPPDVPASL